MPLFVSRWLTAQKMDGILVLIGGFFLHLTLGTLYSFGNMTSYMTSYLRQNVYPDMLYSDMIWIPTLATVSQGIFMTFSGYLEDLIGLRFTIATGCSIMTIGVLLTYYSIQYSVILTVLTYGFMFGLGTALAYAPPLAVAMKWFPQSKGFANGIIVGGFGLGAFVFNQIQTAYLNPLNLQLDDGQYFKDEHILHRVPSVFLLLGSIYGLVQAMSTFLIKYPPDSEVSSMRPLITRTEEEEDSEDQENGSVLFALDNDLDSDEDDLFEMSNPSSTDRRPQLRVSQPDSQNIRPGQIVTTREFWVLWGTFFFNTQAIGYINSMYKAYGQEFIHDDHFLAVVGALAALFNASGRIFWGHLCDVFGYRMCMVSVTIMIAILYLTFTFVSYGGKVMFAFWVWAIFFCFCANFVLLPTVTAQTFGTRYSCKNYGLVMSGQAAAAPVIALLTEFVSPLLGWLGMFTIIAACSVISAVINLLFFPKNPSPKDIFTKLQKPPPSEL